RDPAGHGCIVTKSGVPFAVCWVEHDHFNSTCLHRSVGRCQVRIAAVTDGPEQHAVLLGRALGELFQRSAHELISARMIGAEPVLSLALQLARARFVLTSVWLHRPMSPL